MNKKRTLKKKGGCGCGKSDDLIIKGGASFDVNNPYVNPLNNYKLDPNDPSVVTSVRIQPNMSSSSFLSGGKKRKSKKTKKTKKSKKTNVKRKRKYTMHKQKGGADEVISASNANIASSFNTTLGFPSNSNVLTTTVDQNMNSGFKFVNSHMPFI